MQQGEIYLADIGTGVLRPIIVVSRESLNRGDRVVAVALTSSEFATRSRLPNCVPFRQGDFGLTKDCVAQCETISILLKSQIQEPPIGRLSDGVMRTVVLAIGNVIDSYCEPN